MIMFRTRQVVEVTASDDERLKGRKADVVRVEDDGSALVKFRDSREPASAVVWPEDCRPC